MKCQQCEKPATFHITELTEPQPQELHLCEEHAREYLSESEAPDTEVPQTFAGAMAQQLKVGQTAAELARLDQQACPICGITFYEFRSQGRLGCPNDYKCFAEELEPLLTNIHNQTEHKGKHPAHLSQNEKLGTDLIRLRRQMKEAVDSEEYELASQLRDEIRKIEEQI